jgi:hypothetical protein
MHKIEDPHEAGTRKSFFSRQPVFKYTGEKSKMRVVFDASARPGQGLSFSKATLTGAVVQRSMVEKLISLRMGKCAVTADVRQTYSQVISGRTALAQNIM